MPSPLLRVGILGVLATLSGCEATKPGLDLAITISPIGEAQMVSQVVVSMTNANPAGPMFPMQPAMPVSAGVTVASDGTTETITLDRSAGFNFIDSFQLLLVPSGTQAIQVNLSGRMFDLNGAQIGSASSDANMPPTIQPGTRTNATLAFKCTTAGCQPAKNVVDLSAPGSTTVETVTGDASGDHLVPLAAGSFFASGQSDLVLAAPAKSPAGKTNTGMVYVFRSQNFDAPGFVSANQAMNADITIVGRQGDGLGTAAAVGDVDGDGVDDLVVSGVAARRPYCNNDTAPAGTCTGDAMCQPGGCMDFQCTASACVPKVSYAAAGVAYVFSGKTLATQASYPLTIDLNAPPAAFANVPRIYGAIGQEKLGSSLAVAHLTSTSHADVFLGAPGGLGAGAVKAGRVYVVAGATLALTPTLLLADGGMQSATVQGSSASAGKVIGLAIAAGDLDGDAKAELVIGNFVDGNNSAGSVTVEKGTTLAAGGTIDLTSGGDVKVAGSSGAQLGWSVAIAPVEGGASSPVVDVIAGAPGISAVEVLSPSGGLANLSSKILTLQGPSQSKFGYAVAAGNLAGGTSADLLVGAPASNGQQADRAGSGAAFVIYGQSIGAITGPRTLMTQDVSLFGAAKGNDLGSHVVCANFDSSSPTDEVIVGADNAGGNSQGVAYALKSLPSQ
jgi:hypothetical protein